MGSQPLWGLKDQLYKLCDFRHQSQGIYLCEHMTSEKWEEFQELMTFWGVIIDAKDPLKLDKPQIFKCKPKPSLPNSSSEVGI